MGSNVFVVFLLFFIACLSASYSAPQELDVNPLSLEEELAITIFPTESDPICDPDDPAANCPPPPSPHPPRPRPPPPPPPPPPSPSPSPAPAPCPPPPPPVTCNHCFCSSFLPQHCVCLDVFKKQCLPTCTECLCGSFNNLSLCVCFDFKFHQCSGPSPGPSIASLLPPMN